MLVFNGYSQIHSVKHRSLSLAMKFCATQKNLFTRISQNVRLIRWIPLESHWIKLNTDGSSSSEGIFSGAGGVFRNHEGIWLKGFSIRLGKGDSFRAELWGVKQGLQLARTLSFNRIELNCDAKSVVDVLLADVCPISSCSNLIYQCRLLLRSFQAIKISHSFREASGVADYLAKFGATMDLNYQEFNDAPSFVFPFLTHDLGLLDRKSVV